MTSAAVTWLADRGAEAVRFLEALVNQDSGTYDRDDVNALADMRAGPLADPGFTPRRFPQTEYGGPDEYVELPTLIERARVHARFIELWAERFGGPRAG